MMIMRHAGNLCQSAPNKSLRAEAAQGERPGDTGTWTSETPCVLAGRQRAFFGSGDERGEEGKGTEHRARHVRRD